MKNEKILNSLRCCASVDGASCDNCNDEELGSDKLLPCSDVLKCLAANLIEKLTGRCARYAEEIADVGIMLDQMVIEFQLEDAVAEQRAFKVQRLRERIENDE